tara:strand:+ start:3282 stop:4211 length:930 start_codon:yes stop_codon:yes gene_type:complete
MNKKILIIQLRPGLGDLCMFLPRCHEIALANKNFEITLLTKENTKAKLLLKNDPYIHKIKYIDKNKIKISFLKLLKFFKSENFDMVYSYQYGPKYLKYFFLSKLTGVKKYHFYGIFKKKECMTQRAIIANEKWLKIKVIDREGKIYLSDQKITLNNKFIIGVGASGDNKRWPTENFISLISYLNNFKNDGFILAGGPGDKNIIKLIIQSFPNIVFENLENLNLEECLEKIKEGKIFVGNDTGFMHVSACLGIKTFCLYGDTPSEDAAYNDNIIPILPPNKKYVYHDDLLMDQIKIEDVSSAIGYYLNQK